MKVLELFCGYGTASFALKRLGIPYELVGYSDIDKYANQVFKQNHCPEDTEDKLKLGDIKKVDEYSLPDFDLLTGGTPCQDFSLAGKREGMFDSLGKPTRSGLLLEFVRILRAKKPKYFLWENVKGVLSSKDKITGEYHFDFILGLFIESGYDIDFRLLNTKDYGIPQNRERVWVVGKRKDLNT